MTSYDWMLTFPYIPYTRPRIEGQHLLSIQFLDLRFSSKCLKTSWKLRDFGELVWSLTRMDGLVWKSWENHGNHQDSQDPTVWIPTFWQSPIKKNMAWLRSYYFSPMVLKHFRPRRIRIIRIKKQPLSKYHVLGIFLVDPSQLAIISAWEWSHRAIAAGCSLHPPLDTK